MFQVELPRERKARESVERRRNYEADRRERIFNDKFRTIGVSFYADVQQYNRAACLLQRRQEKADRSAHQARAAFWHQNQNLQSRRDFDLNDPDALKKTESQMVLPGLLGEDPEAGSRQQRQQEQLRDWLLQQKNELQQKRLQMKIDGERALSCRRKLSETKYVFTDLLKRSEENQNRLLLDSARSALLLERLQEKQNKQLRKHLDSVNAQLAQIRLQELVRGRIDDVFFTQFNTCSR
uniref:RIB43A domain with coiled-coils 2 n=1 Tax=Xiphophorus couchianus TaxID=32473 RepID=A0A3B5LC86_9TELE